MATSWVYKVLGPCVLIFICSGLNNKSLVGHSDGREDAPQTKKAGLGLGHGVSMPRLVRAEV